MSLNVKSAVYCLKLRNFKRKIWHVEKCNWEILTTLLTSCHLTTAELPAVYRPDTLLVSRSWSSNVKNNPEWCFFLHTTVFGQLWMIIRCPTVISVQCSPLTSTLNGGRRRRGSAARVSQEHSQTLLMTHSHQRSERKTGTLAIIQLCTDKR